MSDKKRQPILTILTVLLLIFMLLVTVGYFGYIQLTKYFYSASSTDTALYPFTIEEGESISSIARRFEAQGFVRNDLAFRWYCKKQGIVLQAGDYEITKNQTVPELVTLLQHGTFNTTITIIEGWRQEEIVDYLFTTELFTITNPYEVLEEETKKNSVLMSLQQKIKEGYFFPDTYTLNKNSTLNDLIALARSTFNQKIDSTITNKIEAEGLTDDEAVILASIVEREARSSLSRPIVAGILLKRLKNDWPLQADATVQYVMATETCRDSENCVWWPKDITVEDLEIDSPYNTRKYIGLPPGAICNPSLSSLQAVAEVQETEYWYYLTGNDNQMHYARTLEEHNENIANYL